jgi:purine catabolism regulator
MLLNRVATVVGETSGACARAAAGHLVPVVGALDPQARAWADALGAYERADLVDTVRSYLRHRGQWEVAARELKLHRNSLRHRISIASKLIGADLNDPDVAANLWLALRNHA